MRLASLLLGLSVFWAGIVQAQSSIRADHPDRYTVVSGDTLWDISSRFLNTPWLWPEIWQANPEIANPHLIYPGDVVRLVYVDGQPRLVVDRNQIIKLSPTARPEPLAGAIPTLPYNVIGPYLTGNQFVAQGELDAAPYVLAQQDSKILSSDGDIAYVRGESVFGLSEYGIYRQGREFTAPDQERVIGVEAVFVGRAEVDSRNNDLTKISLSDAVREVRAGDRLLPMPIVPTNDFVPSKPPAQIDGQILSVIDGVQQVGQYDIVVLDLGQAQGMQAGNVVSINREGARVTDPLNGEVVQLPDERSGLAMVFRVFDELSYALVLQAQRAMSVGDSVAQP